MNEMNIHLGNGEGELLEMSSNKNVKMRILIYGIGRNTIDIVSKIRPENEIVGYSDSYLNISSFMGTPFIKYENLDNFDFDYAVITISEIRVIHEVYEALKNKIPERKIIPFYTYSHNEKYKLRMENAKSENIEGVIIGNSVSRDAFLTNYMDKKFVNLSSGGLDLFFAQKILNNCFREYKEELRFCRYVIIDLYNGFLFNYDASREKSFFEVVKAFGGGDIIEEHNFKKNKQYLGKDFYEMLWQEAAQKKDLQKKVADEIFLDLFGYEYKEMEEERIQYSRWECINTDEDNGISIKIHNKTIDENIELFKSLINDIYMFNNKIKIVLSLIPWYEFHEDNYGNALREYTRRINKCLGQLQLKQNLYCMDFRNDDINKERALYYNNQHLNTRGAMYLTYKVNKYLEEIEMDSK